MKAPRWTIAFLRALERTGQVQAAARDAGIDHSTAYARRRAHAGFAEEWDDALRLRSGRAAEEEREAVEKLGQAPSTIFDGPPPPAKPGEELVGAGSQMKRVGEGRWGQTKEKVFFDELAATANVRRAAAAAGVSTNAVYARRMKQPLFRAKWAAVLEIGRAAIEMKLVEAANKSFDADDIDTGDVEPRVSVAEAIRIVQIHGGKAEQGWAGQAGPTDEENAAVRERLVTKLQRLRERTRAERMADGWTLDESYDCIVPPGWIKGPDYAPEPAEPDASFWDDPYGDGTRA